MGLVYGLRGVGKAIVLNQFRQVTSENGDRVCFAETIYFVRAIGFTMNNYRFTRKSILLAMYLYMREGKASEFHAQHRAFYDLMSSNAFISLALQELSSKDIVSVIKKSSANESLEDYYQLRPHAIVQIELWADQNDFYFGDIEDDGDGYIEPVAAMLGNRAACVANLEEFLGLV